MKEQTADDEKETEREDRVGYNWLVGWLHIWLVGWMLVAYMYGCYHTRSLVGAC